MADVTLGYPSLIDRLAEALPELRLPLERESNWWKGERPGAYVVFGDLLEPFLEFELRSGKRPAVISRALRLLEEMANDLDPHIQEVVQQSVLGRMCGDRAIERTLREHAPRCFAMVKEYCDAWHEHR